MKVIVQIVEKVVSEAHIYIPDGLSPDAMKQHITDRYNSGELTPDLNIFQVDFESISAKIISNENLTNIEDEDAA
ncbi:hypothetical protein Ava_B0324 (plasmid) [Trichormus variabilis ATCC 29413]|uniref:Uncharacterized protein n=2 Tax=Anabaena variabilis TaxID=264691 RepID=Q3M1V2_TRIV2|nr:MULTISPECIES: hypothetical protein [Nostocaceae]ABA25034.1 hypothetical protein Ava_B0324 [Trichormus variabilis ATCC 29413]MBC1217861.1 hypothetical protein [Trichormus variabilis ARAD]MBC1259149.1 hypothetical protein [Trichormus variabilis V5]MBC1270679.1 hypothetical protein [Trichormus variabilis FSR]MBC1305521.1 hypothetical protein [Trichormus variabilis N2B]